jgi:branched-chain amino acid transport system permease protein
MNNILTPYRSNILLIALGCIVLPKLTNWAMPGLLPGSTSLTLAIAVSLAIAGLSLNLLLGYAGQVSLGHAALLGVGAFAASVVVDRWDAPMFLGWIFAAFIGAAVALVIGLPALRLRGLYLALATMVFGLTMQASVLRWPVFTRGSAGVEVPRRLWGENFLIDPAMFLSFVLLALLLVWVIDRNVLRTKVGRAFRMLRENETAAQAFAIDVTRYKLLAFVLAGAIAGLAGAMYGHSIGLVNSDVFNLDLSLRVVLFVIIGGIGRRWGVAVVAVLFSLNPELPSFLRGYDLVLAAAIVLYNVVKLPAGLAGALDHLRELREKRSGRAKPAPELEEMPKLPRFASVLQEPRTKGDRGGSLLVVDGASVSFGGLRAVDDVSLHVEKQMVVGLIGPNGAGKSTLFNAISGFVPMEGRLTFDGQPISSVAPHLRAAMGMGRTFQHVGLAHDLSVRENMLLAQHQQAAYGDASALAFTRSVAAVEEHIGRRADELIEGLGFSSFASKPVGQLSGGQRRLVEIAAVLSTSPKLLMLDEPTAGLAPAAAEALGERLTALRDEHGQAILLIEHNVPLVLDVCDYVYVLNAGRLLAEGKPSTLGRNPEILSAYLGEAVA